MGDQFSSYISLGYFISSFFSLSLSLSIPTKPSKCLYRINPFRLEKICHKSTAQGRYSNIYIKDSAISKKKLKILIWVLRHKIPDTQSFNSFFFFFYNSALTRNQMRKNAAKTLSWRWCKKNIFGSSIRLYDLSSKLTQ